MAFVTQQHKMIIDIHMTPPSYILPPTFLSVLPFYVVTERAALGSLNHPANFHWLPILHMVMYIFQCSSLLICISLKTNNVDLPWVFFWKNCSSFCSFHFFFSFSFIWYWVEWTDYVFWILTPCQLVFVTMYYYSVAYLLAL